MMGHDIQRSFAEKIEEVYKMDSDCAWRNAEKILEYLPDQLLPNIYEWVQEIPLSDIRIRHFSIPMLLAFWKSSDFLQAAQVMSELDQNPDRTIRKIWNMRR